MTLLTTARDTISAVGKATVRIVGASGGIASGLVGATVVQARGGSVIARVSKGRLSALDGDLSYADLVKAEIAALQAGIGAAELQAQTDLAAAQAAIDQALADEAAARAAADALEAQTRLDLATSISAALAQATADIQAAQAAAASALATAEADITQARADASAALAAAQADLQTSIDAVQASSDGVAASLTTETNERIAGDSAEITARTTAIAGVQSDIGVVAADLTNEQQVRATNDAAEVSAREAAVAGVQDGLDTVTAGLANEESARATAVAAETSARQSAVAAVQDGVDQVSAALTAEQQTRATDDAAETTARQSAISQVQGNVDQVAAALTGEATTRAADDLAETQARQTAVSQVQGNVDQVNAALTAEEGTRATNDTAETNARTAAVSDLQGQVNATNAALTNEATTRASEVAAETSARQSADSNLQGQVDTTNANLTNEQNTRAANDAAEAQTRSDAIASVQGQLAATNAAVQNEETARASAVAAEAETRKTLIAQLAGSGMRSIWPQTTEPSFDQIFPPGVQACPVANLDLSPIDTGIGHWTNTTGAQGVADASTSAWGLAGGRTIDSWLDWTWGPGASGYECFDLNEYGPFYGVVPGATYEWSAYTGTHRARGLLLLAFYDVNNNWLVTFASDGGGSPVAYSGANAAEKVGGPALSDFKRLWVRAVAPANAYACHVYTRADNAGFDGQAYPYQFITRPMFCRVRDDMPAPIDWQPYSPPVWINTADNNKTLVWNGITGGQWQLRDDLRISANQSAITNEAAARSSGDAAETSARQTAISGVQDQINSTNAALTGEQSTRATNDAAEVSARQSAVAGVQSGLDAANSAITNEQNARASGDTAEATARLSLSTTLSAAFGPIKTWTQATAPTFDQMFPVGVQANPTGNLTSTDGLGRWTNTARAISDVGLDMAGWTLEGGHTAWVHLDGQWLAPGSGYECFDLSEFGQLYSAAPGARYEFSVYTGLLRARAAVGILFCDASWNPLGLSWSDGGGEIAPNATLGGYNNSEAAGGTSLSGYKRLGVIATAPANTARLRFIIRGDNQGVAGAYGESSPYIFATRPYWGRALSNQTTFTDWQPFQRPIWYNSSDSNKPYVWNGIYGVGFEAKPDARIDTNTTNISQLFSTTNGYAAMWGVQIDTNGKVVGRVQLNGQNGTSSFDVLATSFTVSMPGYSSPIFEVGNVNGSPKIVMRADVIRDDSIGTSAISPNAITRDAISTGANCNSGSVAVTFKANARTIYLTGIYAGNDVLAGGGEAQINIIVNGSTYYYQGVPRVPVGSSYYGATVVTIAYPVPATDTSATIQCTVTGISGGLGRCTIMMDTRLK